MGFMKDKSIFAVTVQPEIEGEETEEELADS